MRRVTSLALIGAALLMTATACDRRPAPPSGRDVPRAVDNVANAVDSPVANAAPATEPTTASLSIHLARPRPGTRVFVDGRAVATVGDTIESAPRIEVQPGPHHITRVWYDTERKVYDTRTWATNTRFPGTHYATFEEIDAGPPTLTPAHPAQVASIAQPRSQQHMLEILDGKLRYLEAGWQTFTTQPNWRALTAAADHASTAELDRAAIHIAFSPELGGPREIELLDLPPLEDWFIENARYRMDDYCEVGACPMRIGEAKLPEIDQRWADIDQATTRNLATVTAAFERLSVAVAPR